MAIALRAVGTVKKADTGISGVTQSVSLPAGHVANDWLLLTVLTDDNSTPATPSGWSLLKSGSSGTSSSSPYYAYAKLWLYHRIDDGSLGASVNVTVGSSAWPAGHPFLIAWVTGYSGTDLVSPVETVLLTTVGANSASAQAHPQVTTLAASDWLITVRAAGFYTNPPPTWTCSVGTDAERVDVEDGAGEGLGGAYYDSNAALTAGLQTQRTTTGTRSLNEWGACMASIAIKPVAPANATLAQAGRASITLSAKAPSVTTTIGDWDLCTAGGLPEYTLGVDWNQDGSLDLQGHVLNTNPYFQDNTTGWSGINATLTRSTDLGVTTLKIVSTAGASPRAENNQTAVLAGQPYRAYGWLYIPSAVPSTVELNLNWFDSSHVYLSTSNNTAVIPTGTWTLFDQTFTAPASTAYGDLTAVISGTPGAGFVLYAYGCLLINPASPDRLMALGPGEDITSDEIDDIVISYGRDQDRQLSPAAVGTASLRLCNVSRTYSPENVSGPLSGDLDPARDARFTVSWAGSALPLFRGQIDDFDVKANFSDRTVTFGLLDGMALLQNFQLSTPVYTSLRTGELINNILDAAGWTGGRDIDTGATVVKFWWEEGTDALSAVQNIVKSEGPPSVAYVDPDGTFVFHDRHHRLQNSASQTVQGTFTAQAISCASPASTGLSIAQPFEYSHGWRDIVNSVAFEVQERGLASDITDVWTSEDSITLAIGEGVDLDVSSSDPFVEAIVPVPGTDFTQSGAGTVNVSLSRTSGASAKISLLAVGGSVVVSNLKLRARLIPVARTVKVLRQDSGSITSHGEKVYPETAPWADANDCRAIADMILLHYSQRRPTVQLRVLTQDPSHFVQVLRRTIGDRIHIQNGELGLDADFFVERVTHTIQRINQTGHAPVHAVVLGCEKELVQVANPFTFDQRGSGFDDGVFDPIQADDASTVFIFDDPVQGQFDTGRFGT